MKIKPQQLTKTQFEDKLFQLLKKAPFKSRYALSAMFERVLYEVYPRTQNEIDLMNNLFNLEL